MSIAARVAFREGAVTHSSELRDRGLAVLREVGIAVAEILIQVEPELFRELPASLYRIPVVRKELRDLGRRPQEALAVAPSLGLAAVERSAVLDGDERVLQRREPSVVRVDVARRDGRNAERRGQLPQHRVATSVAALERPLKLDEEPIAPKGLRQTRRGVRIPHREPMPCAARQADETLVAFLQQFTRERRVQQP